MKLKSIVQVKRMITFIGIAIIALLVLSTCDKKETASKESKVDVKKGEDKQKSEAKMQQNENKQISQSGSKPKNIKDNKMSENSESQTPKTEVKKGDNVKVLYKGTLENGEVFDESPKDRPLEFTVGAGQMIPGFDKGVEGMKLKEKKTVTIPADEAYGQRDENRKQSFPKSQLPKEIVPEVGMTIGLMHPQTGRPIPAKIIEVTDKEITVDLNHPLAGKTLVFEIEVIDIQ